ncbi:cytochrome b/b6 domain-containing protein [Yoonia litorea]|uniref:Cytochrome b561 n=1 Tax=Yoonia litorea TaxID=1123755 RepID=A0A1I6LWL0_9RHOB|nr:cytochrome b/b6 domain-containing protein [Yoonia litorea]SFS07847.1 Cytochrome b561 [Yoonia litorea]
MTTYGTVTKVFHWLTALLILTVIPLGAIANRLPYETNAELAFKAQMFSLHKTLGVIVFVVALARILWALTQKKPSGLHPERKLETFLADLMHWTLYISLVAVPLTGWIHHAATTGFAPIWLPISQDLPLVPKDEGVAKLFAGLHWAWSKIMVGAILLHLAGALKHHLVDKDATLKRMWFGAKTGETAVHRSSLTAPLAAIGIYLVVTVAGAAAGLYTAKPTVERVALAAVSSDWAVQDGEIALTITQFNAPVTGRFEDWTAAIRFDETATDDIGEVTTTIAIGSLTLGSVTNQALETDFFDAARFPTATFTAEIVRGETGYVADGTLTIKEASVPVVLPFDLTINGDIATMQGAVSLDRRDFQIGNSMNDETNLAFGVDVAITLTASRAE